VGRWILETDSCIDNDCILHIIYNWCATHLVLDSLLQVRGSMLSVYVFSWSGTARIIIDVTKWLYYY